METIKDFESFNKNESFAVKIKKHSEQGEMKKLKDQSKFDKKDDKVMEGENGSSINDTETANNAINEFLDKFIKEERSEETTKVELLIVYINSLSKEDIEDIKGNI